MKKYLIPASALIAGLALGAIISARFHRCPPPSHPSPGVVEVTHVVRDTLRVSVPVPVRMPSPASPDTIRVPVSALVAAADSDSLALPVERLVYADSMFRAVVSGVRPSLDSLTLYPRVTTVTRTLPPPALSRWGLGLTLGLTATPHGISPGLTFGLCFRL